MMRIACDICGKELPTEWGRARLEMTDVLMRTVADAPLDIGWDLCRPCAEKLYEGLLGTKKMMQTLEGTK